MADARLSRNFCRVSLETAASLERPLVHYCRQRCDCGGDFYFSEGAGRPAGLVATTPNTDMLLANRSIRVAYPPRFPDEAAKVRPAVSWSFPFLAEARSGKGGRNVHFRIGVSDVLSDGATGSACTV